MDTDEHRYEFFDCVHLCPSVVPNPYDVSVFARSRFRGPQFFFFPAVQGARGSQTVNAAPRFSSDSARIRPPCMRTICSTMERPSPVPSIFRRMALPARKNSLNRFGRAACGMPMPVSETASSHPPSAGLQRGLDRSAAVGVLHAVLHQVQHRDEQIVAVPFDPRGAIGRLELDLHPLLLPPGRQSSRARFRAPRGNPAPSASGVPGPARAAARGPATPAPAAPLRSRAPRRARSTPFPSPAKRPRSRPPATGSRRRPADS